ERAELIGAVLADERLDHVVELALENLIELVQRQVDAVVGDASLREVVRANALRAVAGADEAPAARGGFALAFLDLGIAQLRREQRQRARFVLVLRALVLALDDDAGRQMRDAHGGVRLVDVLTARSRRAKRVDAQIVRIDLDVADLLELRQHRDGAGRRVDPALRLGRRHALHAMHAGLELEPRVRALADDPADDLLVSAVLAFARAQHLDAPALVLGVSAVHPKEIAGEKRRLVAAGPGADLEEQVR